jgi:phosphopantothenoylcysteine decarboxylase / phosphopantothenate---cysteine ligase
VSPDRSQARGLRVLLCVTGGIAAYKVVHVARELTQLGADVRVVMTRSAQRFVGPQTFAGVTGNVVLTELFGTGPDAPHVELARGADLVIVAPATANALSKMALGIADDLFTNTMLMVRSPILVAPAMHTEMWTHEATQEHVVTLKDRRVNFVGPERGALMSGDEGPGRMSEPPDIVESALELVAHSRDLLGKRVVVTAGGTREHIDSVRFIGNRSSGLMGFEIARAALSRGAEVSLISGKTVLEPPPGAHFTEVETAEEMYEAVMEVAPEADVIVKSAAVADFKPETEVNFKLKKAEGPPPVTLVPTIDILAELGSHPERRKANGILVGFAAESQPDSQKLGELAQLKREQKHADLIVANDVSSPDSGFDVRTNRAVLSDELGITDLGLVTKKGLAHGLIDEVVELLEKRNGRIP